MKHELDYEELYLKNFDKVIEYLNDIKEEVSKIKHQTATLSKKFDDLDYTHKFFSLENQFDNNIKIDEALNKY